MRVETGNRMFPVGLYATLLVALFAVTFPELVAPVETAGRTLVTLPLRAYSVLLDARTVLAATTRGDGPDAATQDRALLRGAIGPPGYIPRICRVVARNMGPLGRIDELVLDRVEAELAGCAPLVTSGNDLIGFLEPLPPSRRGAPDTHRFVRVRLLHFRERPAPEVEIRSPRDRFRPARVAAQVTCRESDAMGELRFLVEPARAIDSWPLRCTLLDDSYLGSRLRHSGDPVTTLRGEEPLVPAGLRVGRLMVWGYPEFDIPIGLFVEPDPDPRAISAVVVWEPADGTGVDARRSVGTTTPVRFTRFPAPRPVGERWLVTAGGGATLADGAALVDGALLLGCLRRPWSGQSLVTPFAVSTRVWALLLRTPDGEVREIVGRVSGRTADGAVRLEVLAPPDGAIRGGELFTGSNGPHCPAGYRIGAAEPAAVQPLTPAPSRSGALRLDERVRGELLVRVPDREVVHPEVYLGPSLEDR